MLEDIERMNLLLDQYRPLLTEKQAEAMELHYTSDLSFKEIAEEMSIPLGTALTWMRTATRKLRDLLGGMK